MDYKRNCPECNNNIEYNTIEGLIRALKKNKPCRLCKNKPKVKNCLKCDCEIIYTTGKKLYCKSCLQLHKQEQTGERNCPLCNNKITYKSIYDKIKADESDTPCWKCACRKMGDKKIGRTAKDVWIDKGMSIEDVEVKWKEQEERRIKSREGYRHSLETIKKIQSKSFIKQYNIHGLTCQGTWERKYIEKLFLENKTLPKNGTPITTPLGGNYIPDFEYNNRFVEIKSTWTYKMFSKLLLDISKKVSIQRDKVIWVGENIKPVQLLVLDIKGNILKEEWYEKEGIRIIVDNLK